MVKPGQEDLKDLGGMHSDIAPIYQMYNDVLFLHGHYSALFISM